MLRLGWEEGLAEKFWETNNVTRVRTRHRAREGRRLDRRGGKVKAVRVETKGADKFRGVRRVRGESVVEQRLEWVRVGKARRLRRRWGQNWLIEAWGEGKVWWWA